MGLAYLDTFFPYKSTIHVGEYTIHGSLSKSIARDFCEYSFVSRFQETSLSLNNPLLKPYFPANKRGIEGVYGPLKKPMTKKNASIRVLFLNSNRIAGSIEKLSACRRIGTSANCSRPHEPTFSGPPKR